MVQFGHDDSSSIDPRRKPPPNYFARGVQVKILAMVFLFMGVLMLMSEARKPGNWRWIWQFEGNSAKQDTNVDAPGTAELPQNGSVNALASEIDTRAPREPDQSAVAPGPVVTGADRPLLSSSQDAAWQPRSPITAQRDGWNHVLRRLGKDQRQLLQVGMWGWRHQHPLPDEEKAAWSVLLQRLGDNWADFHTRAYVSVVRDSDQLTDGQQRASIEIIEASKALWTAQKAALESLGQDLPATPEQAATLTDLQGMLDRRAWARVEDNSVLRSAETEAWYRCWDQLQSLSSQQWDEATGPANFVQLFSQPNEFRGRLIKVSGTARWGYRVASRDPRFGIESYIVLGLLPGDSSGSPIVVYCIELPAGFPHVGPADQAGKGMPLNEDVRITGYFFKRWLHRSEGGMNLAPLILGKVTHWQPNASDGQRESRRSLSRWTMLVSALTMAMLAALIATWVYRGSRWSSTDAARSTRAPDSVPSFDTDDVRGNVTRTLREFEETKGIPPA